MVKGSFSLIQTPEGKTRISIMDHNVEKYDGANYKWTYTL